MTYTFRKAVRTQTNLVIGVAGGTGHGKTYTALRLATGLSRGGKIIAGDTERGRITRYAQEFDFDVDEIKPPFRPQTYIDFLLDAYDQKPSVIIIDSATHEWVSEGGCLEWHSRICREMASKWGGSPEKYNFQAWAEPKQEHWKLISKIEAPPCHIIMTFRAKEKFEQGKDGKGKTQIRSRGLCPDGSEDLPYSMDFIALLEDADNPGVASYTYKPLTHTLSGILKSGDLLTEKQGEQLSEWAQGGKSGGRGDGATGSVPKQGSMNSAPTAERNANAADSQNNSGCDFQWRGSDGILKTFKDSESFRKAVMEGIAKSTDVDKLSLSLASNSGEMGNLRLYNHGTLADDIEYAINEKKLRLGRVSPPI